MILPDIPFYGLASKTPKKLSKIPKKTKGGPSALPFNKCIYIYLRKETIQ